MCPWHRRISNYISITTSLVLRYPHHLRIDGVLSEPGDLLHPQTTPVSTRTSANEDEGLRSNQGEQTSALPRSALACKYLKSFTSRRLLCKPNPSSAAAKLQSACSLTETSEARLTSPMPNGAETPSPDARRLIYTMLLSLQPLTEHSMDQAKRCQNAADATNRCWHNFAFQAG